jgi:NAD(P)-dependent dehydrogenase (short-subunit alcohol dehydrogenase family)
MRTGRTVLITGAAGGIGTELVRRFLENGDGVIALDGEKGALERLTATVDAGERLVTRHVDVTDEPAIDTAAQLVRARGAGLDVLIACHGWFPFRLFEEVTPEDFRRIVDVNLTGTFLVVRAMLPLMRDRGWGRIVLFGSGSIFEGSTGFSPYVAAKAGVVGMSRSLAREVGGYGITVNTVTPGLTATPVVVENFPAEALAARRSRRAIARDQHAADHVGPVFFLASPDADFRTGQIVNVDGGNHMH